MSNLRGLYAITPDALVENHRRLCLAVEAALRGGAILIQYRDKKGDADTRRRNAHKLNSICTSHGARLIINDDVALAAEVGAAGVHLGASDRSVAVARHQLGPSALIGSSCGPWLERGHIARDVGASYVAFGRFFDSRTKPEAPGADLDTLISARAQITLPICAIGGITPANGRALIDAGADLLAAVDGVFGNADPAVVESAARAYTQLFAG